jgi:hypothetical protein
MITSIVLSLLLAALTGTTADAGPNPVQHSEARASQETTADSRGLNPVQHSE